MSPQQPNDLLAGLLRAARNADVSLTLHLADLTGSWDFIDDDALRDIAEGRVRLIALAGSIPQRLAGVVDHLGISLWDVDRLIKSGLLPVDIFIERVRSTRERRRFSHGDMIGYSPTALEVAKRVGVEVASAGPIHRGEEGFAAMRAEVAVQMAKSAGEIGHTRAFSQAQVAVARRLAALIPSGATLQLGVGGTPAALATHLGSKADLGLHSGVLPAELRALIASGVITGRRKTTQASRHVATGLTGAAADWGPSLLLQPLSITHDPARLLEHENLWAVNSGLQVDLSGQVNAEYIGDARVAIGAGQIDFARAAHSSPAGASVIALPARSTSGAPRIIERISTPITIGGNDVDYLVTEHGIAQLRGRSAKERAEAVIAVAHPMDRPRLRAGVLRRRIFR